MSKDIENPVTDSQTQRWQRLLRGTEAVERFTEQRLRQARTAALEQLEVQHGWHPGYRGLLATGLATCAAVAVAVVLVMQAQTTAPQPSLESLQWASEDDHAHDLYRNLDMYEWMDQVESEQPQPSQEGLSMRSMQVESA